MEDRKIYVSSTGDAFVDPAKDVNIPEENKISESLFTRFTKKMAGIDKKATQKIVNKEGYDLWKKRKEIAEGYAQGKYFDKAHNLDILSGLIFRFAGLIGAQKEVVEVLAPTIRQLIKTTNNPILKQFLAITTTGILRAETAKEVALKEKLFKKIDTTLDVLRATGSHAFQFIKTVAGYIGNEIKQLSQNFVTSTDDLISNLLTNAGFLGPFVKMLWPYIERAMGLIRKAIWGGLKFLAKGMFSPVKYLGQMLVSKIFAPKKETVASVATSKSLIRGVDALKGSLDLIKSIVGEEKVVNNKIFNKVSKIASAVSKNHSLGETKQSPFVKLSNVFRGGYFSNKNQIATKNTSKSSYFSNRSQVTKENISPRIAYAKAPAFASLGALFGFPGYKDVEKKYAETEYSKSKKIKEKYTTTKYNKNGEKEEHKSFSLFSFLRKNREEAKIHRQKQEKELEKYKSSSFLKRHTKEAKTHKQEREKESKRYKYFNFFDFLKKRHTEIKYNKNKEIKRESEKHKSINLFDFLRKNREESKTHRQKQQKVSKEYRKTKSNFVVGSLGSIAMPFVKTADTSKKFVVLKGISYSNEKQHEQSIIIRKINQIYKQIVQLTKSSINRIKTTGKISSILSKVKTLQAKTVSKISGSTKDNIITNLKSIVKRFGSFIFKGLISTTRKLSSYLYDKLNIKSIKESKTYQKFSNILQKSNDKIVTSLRIISKKLQSPKEKFSEKILERRQEEKKIKIQEKTNDLLTKLVRSTKGTVSRVSTSSPFGMLKNILGGVFSFGASIFGSLFAGASKFMLLLLGALGIKSLGGWIFKGIKNSVSWIAGKLIGGVRSFTKNVGPWIVKGLKNTFKTISTIGKEILKKLGVIGLVLAGINLLKKSLVWVKDKILKLFKFPEKVIGGIKNFFVKKLAGIKEAVQGVFNPLKSFISEKFTALLKLLAKIPVIGALVKPLLNKETKPKAKVPSKTKTGSKSKLDNTVKSKTKTPITKPNEAIGNKTKTSVVKSGETIKNKTKVVTKSVERTAGSAVKNESKILSKGLNLAKTTLKTAVRVAEKGLASAFLIYDQIKHGFDTKENFGLDVRDTTWDQRLSQMSGTVIDNLSFGLINRKTAAKNIDTTINQALHFIGKGREDRVAKAPKTYTPGNTYVYDYYPDEGKYILGIPGTNLKFIKFKSGTYKIGNKYVPGPEADIIISYYSKYKKMISRDKFGDILLHRVFPFSHFVSDTNRGYIYFITQRGNSNKRLYYTYDKKKSEWIISGKRFTNINEVRKVLGNFYKYGKITKEERQHIKSVHSKSTGTQLKNETRPSVITSVANILTSVSDKFKSIITKKSSQQNEIKDISNLISKNDNQVVEKIVPQLSKKGKETYFISKKILSDNNITSTEVGYSSNKLKPINLTNLPVNIPGLTAMLIKHEGIRLHEYKDHLGYKTIGIGHLIDERKNGIPLRKILGVDKKRITPSEALYIFAYDLKRIGTRLFNKLPWLKKKPEPVRRALLDMAFQMGVGGLLKFKPTLKLIKQDKYAEATERLKKSLWFRQTGRRASEIIQKIVSVIPTVTNVTRVAAKPAAGAALSLAVATANPNIPVTNQKTITAENQITQHKIFIPETNQSNQVVQHKANQLDQKITVAKNHINQYKSSLSIPSTNQKIITAKNQVAQYKAPTSKISQLNQKIATAENQITQHKANLNIPDTNQRIVTAKDQITQYKTNLKNIPSTSQKIATVKSQITQYKIPTSKISQLNQKTITAESQIAQYKSNPDVSSIDQKIITANNQMVLYKTNQSDQKISNLVATNNINQPSISIPKTNQLNQKTAIIKNQVAQYKTSSSIPVISQKTITAENQIVQYRINQSNRKIASSTIAGSIEQPSVSTSKVSQSLVKLATVKNQNDKSKRIHQQLVAASPISIEKPAISNSTVYLSSKSSKNNITTKSHIAENDISQPIRNFVTNLNTDISNVTSPSQVLAKTFDMREQVLVSRNNTYRKSQQTTNHSSEVAQVHNVPIMVNQQQYINNVQQTSYNHATKFIQPTGKADSMRFNIEFS